MIRSLRNISAPLRRLLVAQLPSDLADWLDFVAIGTLLTFTWGAPPEAFALLAVAMGLPYLLVGPLVAAVVDRSDLRAVMVGASLGRAASTFALILAPNWPVLLGIVALRAAVDSAYTPAKQAAIQALAPEGELAQVNSLSFTIMQMSKIVAPLVGGALLAALSPASVFALNGGVSLLAAALMLRLPRDIREPAADRTPMLASLRGALALVAQSPALRLVFVSMGLGLFGNFIFDTQIPPMIQALGFGPQVLGGTLAAVGLGAVAGAMLPLGDSNAVILRAVAVAAGGRGGVRGPLGGDADLAGGGVFAAVAGAGGADRRGVQPVVSAHAGADAARHPA